MAFKTFFVAVGLLSIAGLLDAVPQGSGGHSSSQYPYEQIPSGKYAAVIILHSNWQGAKYACESDHPGATLFTVQSPADSAWLGQRINIEKDRISGSSKFWVGLTSNRGNRRWLTGEGYYPAPEVVQIDGDEDDKINAWAVPDSGSRLKYEFKTRSDEAEAFICQHS